MKKSYELVMKDITGATETTVDTLRLAVLESMAFLHPILDKVVMESGTLLHPYTVIPAVGATSHVIGGMELTRTTDVIIRKLVKETVEDANPTVGIEKALETIMAQQAAQEIEKYLIDTMLADGTIVQTAGAGVDWSGIENSIIDMGTNVFNTKGRFLVALSLDDFFAIIRDADFERANDVLKDKVTLVVSAGITAGNMLIIHEHGVAGSFAVSNMEEDSSPSSDSVELVLPYKVGLGFDANYIRKVVVV